MDDVDDQAVCGGAQGKRPRGDQQCDDMEQEREMTGHCKGRSQPCQGEHSILYTVACEDNFGCSLSTISAFEGGKHFNAQCFGISK